MSLIKVLRHKSPGLTVASKYTALNGVGYLVIGVILIVWPGVTQTLFREPDFIGHEQALMRAGRRLQSLGQLLEQDPKRVVAKGFPIKAEVTGARPLEIDMNELRGLFDAQTSQNIGRLLAEYQQLIAQEQAAG